MYKVILDETNLVAYAEKYDDYEDMYNAVVNDVTSEGLVIFTNDLEHLERALQFEYTVEEVEEDEY